MELIYTAKYSIFKIQFNHCQTICSTKPKMMDLIRTPTTKSLILTLITSSMIIELMNSKKFRNFDQFI